MWGVIVEKLSESWEEIEMQLEKCYVEEDKAR